MGWARGRRIIPAEAIFEQCYESGSAVRWCIQQPGAVPMGVAGMYRQWRAPDGKLLFTFAMLTISGAGHPVFQRMHAPADEKRMVAILEPAEYDRWLQCSPAEALGMLRQWEHQLEAFAAPIERRKKAG